MKCDNCKKNISKNDNYCPYCGQRITPEKLLNDSQKRCFVISILFVIIVTFLLFLLNGIAMNMDVNLEILDYLIVIVIIVSVVIFIYILSKDSFAKKGQSVRYKVVINSKFNDDTILQQLLIQKLSELKYKKVFNSTGNTYKKKFMNEYISYNIQNGKIYLEAFMKQFNKEIAPHYGFYGIAYKRFFMREISQIVNYFQN